MMNRKLKSNIAGCLAMAGAILVPAGTGVCEDFKINFALESLYSKRDAENKVIKGMAVAVTPRDHATNDWLDGILGAVVPGTLSISLSEATNVRTNAGIDIVITGTAPVTLSVRRCFGGDRTACEAIPESSKNDGTKFFDIEGNQWQISAGGTPCHIATSCHFYLPSWAIRLMSTSEDRAMQTFPDAVVAVHAGSTLDLFSARGNVLLGSIDMRSGPLTSLGNLVSGRFSEAGHLTLNFSAGDLHLDMQRDRRVAITAGGIFVADDTAVGTEYSTFKVVYNKKGDAPLMWSSKDAAVWSDEIAVTSAEVWSESGIRTNSLDVPVLSSFGDNRENARFLTGNSGSDQTSIRKIEVGFFGLSLKETARLDDTSASTAAAPGHVLAGDRYFTFQANKVRKAKSDLEGSSSEEIEALSAVETRAAYLGQVFVKNQDGKSCNWLLLTADSTGKWKKGGITSACESGISFSGGAFGQGIVWHNDLRIEGVISKADQ